MNLSSTSTKWSLISTDKEGIGILCFYGLFISILKTLFFIKTYTLLPCDIIGPIRFLNNEVSLDKNTIAYDCIKSISMLPFIKLSAQITKVIGIFNYELIMFFAFSFIYFIGIFLLCEYFLKESRISLITAVILSISSVFSFFQYGYPFSPASYSTIGALTQGLIPLILLSLVSKRFILTIVLLIVFIMFHTTQGIILTGLAFGYIAFRKDKSPKERICFILSISLIVVIYIFFISRNLQGNLRDINFSEWERIISLRALSFYMPWHVKGHVSTLLYTYLVVIILLFVVKDIGKSIYSNFMKGERDLYYITYIVLAYTSIVVIIAIGGYYFKSTRILSFNGSRTAILLIFPIILLLAVFSKFLIEEYRIKSLPLIFLFLLTFLKAPFLFFPLILFVKKKYHKEFSNKQIIISFLIFISCLMDFSHDTEITFSLSYKKLFIGFVAVISWFSVYFSDRLRKINLRPIAFHGTVVSLILMVFVLKVVKFESTQPVLTSIYKYEKELLNYIDNKVPKNAVFFVFETNSEKDNSSVSIFSYVNYRCTLLTPEQLAVVSYFPQITSKTVESLKIIYDISIEDMEKSQSKRFFLAEKAMKFTPHDWLRIKRNYKNFDYVLMTDDLNFSPPDYFENVFSNKYFRLYKIKWWMLA